MIRPPYALVYLSPCGSLRVGLMLRLVAQLYSMVDETACAQLQSPRKGHRNYSWHTRNAGQKVENTDFGGSNRDSGIASF